MDSLRNHLASVSANIAPSTASSFEDGSGSATPPTRLASLSQTHMAVLHKTDTSATLHIYATSPYNASAGSAQSSEPIDLPPDAHTLLPARGMLAVVGDRSVTVIDRPTMSTPVLRRVGAPLFAARPGLRLRCAAWAPHAPGFLLTLTTDAHLRLFDVLSRPSSDVERLRIRVVANAGPPVSFAFGRGPGWHALAVYVLMADGAIFTVAPLAPIGTRIPRALWTRLRERTRAVIDASSAADGASAGDGGKDGGAWALRQAHMQLRFLDHVFEPAAAGDLVAVREFKPAPLLFQGPLFVEQDDVPDDDSRTYTSLTALNCGPAVPPVLLRAAADGTVSVLVALERVEPQWFLSTDLSTTPALPPVSDQTSGASAPIAGDEAVVGPTDEYAAAAEQVAPSLLCFEQLAFPTGPVSLTALGGTTDADVLFAATSSAVHALRLSFISVIGNPDALERIPHSSISALFSTASPGESVASPRNAVLGLAPLYVAGQGPVAIALSADGRLHASAPLRWASDMDTALPPDLLVSGPSAAAAWAAERPRSGSRAFARADLAVEVAQTLERARALSADATTRVAGGTLGVVSQLPEFAPVLDELERRVAAMTGGSAASKTPLLVTHSQHQPGALDALTETSSLLSTWSAALLDRVDAAASDVFEVSHAFARARAEELEVRRKADRVAQSSAALEARLEKLRRTVDRGAGQLSAAEAGHVTRLRERRRRLAALRERLDELSGAVSLHVAGADGQGGAIVMSAGGAGGGSGGMFGAMPDPSTANASMYATPTRLSGRFSGQFSGRVSESPARRRLSSAFSAVGTPATIRDARRGSVGSSPWRATEPPLARRRPEWSPQRDVAHLGPRELMQIRGALEKHSGEIERAMQLSSALWKRLSLT